MVTPDEIDEIVAVWKSGADKTRRDQAKTRLDMDGDHWLGHVERHLYAVYQDSTVAHLKPHLTSAVNLQQRVTDRLATAYRRQPRREISKVSAERQREFLDLYRDSGLHPVTASAGRYAWLLGRVGVCFGEDQRARLLYPSSCAVVVEDEHAEPTIVMFESSDDVGEYAVLTASGMARLDKRFKVVANEKHGLGRVPVAWARASLPRPGDWWCATRGSKLSQATISVARIQAMMSWVRAQQNRKIIEITSEAIDSMTPNQANSPDTGMQLTGLPQDVRMAIHDYIVEPKPFVDEIRWHVEAIAEQYGIPSSLIDLDTTAQNAGAWSPDSKSSNTALLSELRDDQVTHFQAFEADLAKLLVATMPGKGVSVDDIDKKFSAHWPPIVVAQNPGDRVKSYQSMMELGLISPSQAYQLEYPTLTIDEAKEAQMANLEERADMIEFMTKRQMPADASKDTDNLAQKQGGEGGRPTEDDEDGNEPNTDD